MITKRYVSILVALALLVVAALTFRTAVATSAVVTNGRDLSDYVLRHPNTAAQSNSTSNLDDYWLRHPGKIGDDYALTQSDTAIQTNSSANLDDYALRHPSARIQPEFMPDTSDWYLRHATEYRQQSQPDLSDYYLRHSAEVKH